MTLDVAQLDIIQLNVDGLDVAQLDLKSGVGEPTIPLAPSALTATIVSDVAIDLAWTDNSDDEVTFRIERRIGAGAWSEIASVATDVVVYSDTGLTEDTQYGYRVRARNLAGDSSYTSEATATTLGLQTILNRAEALWHASNYSGSGDLLDEANSHDAVVTGPVFLVYDGTQYMRLTGITGNYASTPDSVALSIVGDIDLRCRVALDDWTPAAITRLVSKYTVSGSQISYSLLVRTPGTLQLVWSTDGSALGNEISSVSVSATDGDTIWCRATLDVSTGDVIFYTSTDTTNDHTAVTWTQLGATQPGSATSIFDGTALLEIGSRNIGTIGFISGNVYAAQVLSGIDGTVEFGYSNVSFVDGHVDKVRLGELWTLMWHKGFAPSTVVLP